MNNLATRFKNKFLFQNKYKSHSEAVIIACYFNPQNNPYRLKAFKIFYESIKHLNHHIMECVIGDTKPQLWDIVPEDNRKTIYTQNLLWHKETLLNSAIAALPKKFKYVFWVDADVIFTNTNWLLDSVETLQENNICQPFEYCIHLDKDELKPSFYTGAFKVYSDLRHPKMWKSFCSNHDLGISGDKNYDKHGHVGFAWGARREVVEAVPLYDRALIGGADHIIAHAAAGQIGHSCITKSFTDDIDAVNEWSRYFYNVCKGKIGYAKGDLYHIWHGDIEKRQYLKRIQDFTPKTKNITKRDENGLHITEGGDDEYVKQYFDHREVKQPVPVRKINKTERIKEEYSAKREELRSQYPNSDDGFIDSLLIGYFTDDALLGSVLGGNPVGAIIGDMLNDNDQPSVELGGGDFGGAGSGGSWDDTTTQSDSTQVDINVPNDNFS